MAILVTGFGPYGTFESNPSWEAIRDGRLKVDREGWTIETAKLDFSYDAASKFSETVWQKYDPVLVVHLGFEINNKSFLQFEQFAREGPYVKEDSDSYAPHANQDSRPEKYVPASTTHNDRLETCLNIDLICDQLNLLHREGKIALLAKKSTDAGLYIGEYLYYRTLTNSALRRAVFVHVPDVMNFEITDITLALKCALEFIIDHYPDKKSKPK